MKITISGGPRLAGKRSLLVVPCYQENGDARAKARGFVDGDWAAQFARDVAPALAAGDFTGKVDTSRLLYTPEGLPAERVLLLGLGPLDAVDGETLRRYGGAAASAARGLEGRDGVVLLPGAGKGLDESGRARAVTEGLGIGSYAFLDYKAVEREEAKKKISALALHIRDAKGIERIRRECANGEHVAHGVNVCRRLGNLPPNDLGPVELAAYVSKEGEESGFRVKVLDDKAIEREGMGALLGVAQGSERPARLIVLEYGPKRAAKGPPLVFVGKAITFDTGGISIKPAEGMQDMKFDMCGGAAVCGALSAIARIKPACRVVGLIAAAENMPSGSAIRPGDILTSAAGITIEIINTDAEGRLVLADALHYAKRYKPGLVVDLATLTGACVVALGSVNAGLFGKDAAIVERVRKAAAEAGERLWPMPLDDAYQDLIKSDVADVKNSGGRWGGAITAAAFLSKFIEGHPWVHLDIAGTSWTDKESGYLSKGATGMGVRTLVRLAETRG